MSVFGGLAKPSVFLSIFALFLIAGFGYFMGVMFPPQVESASNTGTCLPIEKGGTNCDPIATQTYIGMESTISGANDKFPSSAAVQAGLDNKQNTSLKSASCMSDNPSPPATLHPTNFVTSACAITSWGYVKNLDINATWNMGNLTVPANGILSGTPPLIATITDSRFLPHGITRCTTRMTNGVAIVTIGMGAASDGEIALAGAPPGTAINNSTTVTIRCMYFGAEHY